MIKAISKQPKGILIYSNNPAAIYIFTGRLAHRIPVKINLKKSLLNDNYQKELEGIGKRLRHESGIVAYFYENRAEYLPSEEELIKSLSLRPLIITDDGVILCGAERDLNLQID